MLFTQKSLSTLEYDKIVLMLAELAATDGAKARALALTPSDDYNLVVTAACSVKLLADITYTLGQLCLDEHMYVLGIHIKLKLTVVYVCKNISECFYNLFT